MNKNYYNWSENRLELNISKITVETSNNELQKEKLLNFQWVK